MPDQIGEFVSNVAAARRDWSSSWSRRELLRGAGLLWGSVSLWPRLGFGEERYALSESTKLALGSSRLVYLSPLHADGRESRCHGEVWFFQDGSDVVVVTAKDRWKARALGKGWDRARIWVGDFGPVKQAGDRFRAAPTFVARAGLEPDRAAFDRLLAAFGSKYPEEWGKWEPRFKQGYADGSRVLIRYRPEGD